MSAPPATPTPAVPVPARIRHLVVVLGDQLDADSAAFDGFDAQHDCIWMAEVAEESTHVWSSRIRIVMFLAAMRHFAESLRARGWPVLYRELPRGSGSTDGDDGDDSDTPAGPTPSEETLAGQLAATLRRHAVARVRWVQPGDWRVQQALRAAVGSLPLDELDDRHFLSTPREFAAHARGRRQLRMEFFYREMRRRHGVLMERAEDGSVQPAGGQWNFDADNREAFGAEGPGAVPPTPRFAPDAITRAVIAQVQARFADHPGDLEDFGWPVTRAQALQGCTASSASACRTSAAPRTRSGPVSPGCTTPTCRRR
jgi:deoxyribodipyrimidine photolyase-related protein